MVLRTLKYEQPLRAGPGHSELQKHEHVAGCQAVNSQLVQSGLQRGMHDVPRLSVLLGLFQDVPQQNGRAHTEA